MTITAATNIETTVGISEEENTVSNTPKIDQDVNKRVNLIIDEQNQLIKERSEVIHGVWAARVAQQHVLMLGPGGTGKSFLARNTSDHIIGSKFFECALDETTDPAQVFGPPDIKEMVENGKMRRNYENMLPDATDAFLDEFFNANGPLLHSIMPALNERIFHNNGTPMDIELRQMLAGTNKLNADADQAALWDRIHLRYVVDYIQSRQNAAAMVGDAIARMSLKGRGTNTSIGGAVTTVTLAELDQAHKEALNLDVPDSVVEAFFDICDELQHTAKITVSDRRKVEGMAAVLGNAWVRNHEEVKVADLDILSHMWWTLQDQASAARAVILGATNPGEKAALDLLDDLDKLKAEVKQANDSSMDEARKKRVGVQVVQNSDKLIREAEGHLEKAKAAGAATNRIQDVIDKAEHFKIEVGKSIFNIDPAQMTAMSKANS